MSMGSWRVRRKAKSWKRQMSWGPVIADHLGLMRMSDETTQHREREDEVRPSRQDEIKTTRKGQ